MVHSLSKAVVMTVLISVGGAVNATDYEIIDISNLTAAGGYTDSDAGNRITIVNEYRDGKMVPVVRRGMGYGGWLINVADFEREQEAEAIELDTYGAVVAPRAYAEAYHDILDILRCSQLVARDLLWQYTHAIRDAAALSEHPVTRFDPLSISLFRLRSSYNSADLRFILCTLKLGLGNVAEGMRVEDATAVDVIKISTYGTVVVSEGYSEEYLHIMDCSFMVVRGMLEHYLYDTRNRVTLHNAEQQLLDCHRTFGGLEGRHPPPR